MSDLRLLVLSAGTQVGQNILATLAGRRGNVSVIATSSVDNEPALFDFDAVYAVPQTAAAPEAFEARLLDIIAREQADLVIPCRDDDVLFLAMLRDRRPDLAPRLLCGAAAAARVINDKWLSHEFAEQHRLPFAASMIGGAIRTAPPSCAATDFRCWRSRAAAGRRWTSISSIPSSSWRGCSRGTDSSSSSISGIRRR